MNPDQPQNLNDHSMPVVLPLLKISWKFIHNFLSNSAETDRQTPATAQYAAAVCDYNSTCTRKDKQNPRLKSQLTKNSKMSCKMSYTTASI